jgi:hypothetical protein
MGVLGEALLLALVLLAEPLSDRVVDYQIEATLDAKAKLMKGSERLTWHNRSDQPQQVLWFHLYWNAFKNERSTFHREARESGGFRQEFPDLEKDDWGWQDVRRIAVVGRTTPSTVPGEGTKGWGAGPPNSGAGVDVTSSLRFERPDDGNADDETVFTVTLPEAVPPGGSVTLEIDWDAHVPRVIARAGFLGDFFMIAQWFPKIGVLEVPPSRGADKPRWNCHQFHATSEFYADFGSYDVKLTVPAKMKVGATGVQLDRKENPDGTATWHFHQDDVHDFAWTAWEGFEVVKDRFSEPGLPEVELELLLHPEHRASRQQYLDSTKAALRHFGQWWLPWPYPKLTLVDPPEAAAEAGGMEYPMLITLGTTRYPTQPRDLWTWEVTVHELGHNYWYGILASNEFEEAWLDEGINSYGTGKVLAAEKVAFDTEQLVPQPWRAILGDAVRMTFTEEELILPAVLLMGDWNTPITVNAWSVKDIGDYFTNSYPRTQLALLTLERLLGEEAMGKVMRTYVERWKFKHPRSEDFFAVVNEVTGQDWTWFFDTFWRGTDRLDYAVESIDCEPERPEELKGIFGPPGERKVVEEPEGGLDDDEGLQRCKVMLVRRGGAQAPMDVRVDFEDGSTKIERWEPTPARWKRLEYVGGSRVKQAVIDPERRWVLDTEPANNSRTRDHDGRVPSRILGWMLYAWQLVAALLLGIS